MLNAGTAVVWCEGYAMYIANQNMTMKTTKRTCRIGQASEAASLIGRVSETASVVARHKLKEVLHEHLVDDLHVDADGL